MLDPIQRFQQKRSIDHQESTSVRAQARSVVEGLLTGYNNEILETIDGLKPDCKIEVLEQIKNPGFKLLGRTAMKGAFTLRQYVGEKNIPQIDQKYWKAKETLDGWFIPDNETPEDPQTGLKPPLAVVASDGRIWLKPIRGASPDQENPDVYGVNGNMSSPEELLINLARAKPENILDFVNPKDSNNPPEPPSIIKSMHNILDILQKK